MALPLPSVGKPGIRMAAPSKRSPMDKYGDAMRKAGEGIPGMGQRKIGDPSPMMRNRGRHGRRSGRKGGRK